MLPHPGVLGHHLARLFGCHEGSFRTRDVPKGTLHDTCGGQGLATVACSRHVMLPVLGTIKTHESTRKLHRRTGPRRSTPRPSGARQGGGSCGSPWKSSAPKIGVDLGITTLAVFSDGRPPAENPKHYDTPPAQTRSAVPRGVPQNRGRTGAPVSARPTVGAAPTTGATRSTTGYRTCAVMASTSSLPALPASAARSWWKTSPWPGC
jgi:hypothetical protein